jgi:hypothetical protein
MVDLRSIELSSKKQQCDSGDDTNESAHDELRDRSFICFDSDSSTTSHFDRLLVSEAMKN